MKDINELRKEIDRIDGDITSLFLKRMEVCRDVGRYKLENGVPVLDSAREQQLLKDKCKGLSERDSQDISRLFRCIMDISKDEQKRLFDKKGSVAYCGTKGAYGYFAAQTQGVPKSYGSFDAVINAVTLGEAELGVLPIENTTSGSVLEVYDSLGQSSLFITGEIIIPIHHCLLGLGAQGDVKTVLSHPQAIAQCSKFLDAHSFSKSQSVNTAIAARDCKAAGDKSTGVIASRQCGELYGLNILWENIEDRPGNMTRFVVLSRSMCGDSGANKASITFTLPHRKGSLFEILDMLKSVNLTKIESRPVGGFEYRFYLDFESPDPQEIINRITQKCNTIRVLGVYTSA